MRKNIIIASRLLFVILFVTFSIYIVVSWINVISNNTGLGNVNGIYEWNLFRLILARV